MNSSDTKVGRGVGRRSVLGGLGGFVATSMLSLNPAALESRPRTPKNSDDRRRALRVAHLTDIHIQPERNAVAGLAACLHHAQSLDEKPDLILTGGDHVMDSFDQKLDRTMVQWDLLTKTFKDENSIPIRYCLGNHDIWGWNKARSATRGDEKGWGKTLAMDQLHLAKPYYSFDQRGWHFVVLDSVRTDPHDPNGYVGGLDDEQFDWFKNDLAANSQKPTLLLTHIPILTITVLDTGLQKDGTMKVGGGVLFTDWPRVKGVLNGNLQVKTVISGHMHRIDRVDFQGVTHYCNGAVSGNWWKGRHHEAGEGYTVMDLYEDGSVERKYVEFGWRAEKE